MSWGSRVRKGNECIKAKKPKKQKKTKAKNGKEWKIIREQKGTLSTSFL